MDIWDAKFSLTDGKEITNTHEIVKYSLKKKSDDSYVLEIGKCFCNIELRFEMEMTAGVLHWNCGAASMREMLENEEMERQPAKHLFLYIGKNKIDLYEEVYPVEIRIGNTHVTYEPGDLGDLEFDLEIVFGEGGSDWKKVFSFTVYHSEDRYTFTYLDNMYDSKKLIRK